VVSGVRLHLTFPADLTSEPILHRVATDFGLVTIVRRANLEEERGGWVIVEVEGPDDAVGRVITWLAEQGLQVERIEP
jgi:hypothetical protein